MAIINSLAIGKSVKSAGNLTYKTVRGRTIVSQRITQNKSNTPFQQSQRRIFAKVSASMKLLQQYISVCYEKSKYGSSRNAFFSINPRFTLGNLVGEIAEGIEPLSRGMLSALTEVPMKQLSMLSYGSLPGFLSIRYKDVENYKYNEQPYNTLRVINNPDSDNYSTGSYSFQFSTPVRYQDLKLYVFGFSDSGLLTNVGTVNEAGAVSFRFSGSALESVVASSRPYFSDTDEKLVISVSVEVNMSAAGNCPILIAVPSVGGRVPTIGGIFAKTSEV